jgi:single-strand DNA-binding protein
MSNELRMPTINQTTMSGNLTRDPETINIAGGSELCKFGIAHNEYFKVNGEKQERTIFMDVVCWGKTAEIAAAGLKKGYPVIVEGRTSQSEWDDRETGQKRVKQEITATRVHCLRWASNEGANGGGNNSGGYTGSKYNGQAVHEPAGADEGLPF